MKVFISYHRANSKYRKKLEDILHSKNIHYYVVPENADFNNYHHQQIASEIINDNMENCDVTLCIIGNETYTRPHVDHELKATFKGRICSRKGLVGIMLENRGDNKNNINFNTFPNRIQDNLNYVVLEQWASIEERIEKAIYDADMNRCNEKIQVNNKRKVMKLRSNRYYEN